MPNISDSYACKIAALLAQCYSYWARYKLNVSPALEVNGDIARNFNIIASLHFKLDSNLSCEQSSYKNTNDREFMGFLLQSKKDSNDCLLLFRGTGDDIGWTEKVKFELKNAFGSKYHVDKWMLSIYNTASITFNNESPKPLVPALRDFLDSSKIKLTVAGHSIGAALATYCVFELTQEKEIAQKVSLICFGSPRVGDSPFCHEFRRRCRSHDNFIYTLDSVPNVPAKMNGFFDLGSDRVIDPSNSQSLIASNKEASHSILSYSAMLDRSYTDSWEMMCKRNFTDTSYIIGANEEYLETLENEKPITAFSSISDVLGKLVGLSTRKKQ